jgi:hypothetical protein
VVTLNMTSCRTMSKNKFEKRWKSKILKAKKTSFLAPSSTPLRHF